MNTIIFAILCAAVFAFFITVKVVYEVHANIVRKRRGEPVNTDYEFVHVIDWTRH